MRRWLVAALLLALPACHGWPVPGVSRHAHGRCAQRRRSGSRTVVRARVSGIESTPNPQSFLFRIDAPAGEEQLAGDVSSLRGVTVRTGGAAPGTPLADILQIPGVDSVVGR